jgi:hypothetical protein
VVIVVEVEGPAELVVVEEAPGVVPGVVPEIVSPEVVDDGCPLPPNPLQPAASAATREKTIKTMTKRDLTGQGYAKNPSYTGQRETNARVARH